MKIRELKIAGLFFYIHCKNYKDYDRTFLKVYGDKKIKLVRMSVVKASGYDNRVQVRKCTANDRKLYNNLSRAKNKVYELAICNKWDWFFTGTLNPKKYNREDLTTFHEELTQWFRNYGKKYKIKIKYLLIPELHSDGKSWHMHGLLKGLPVEHLSQFKIGDTMGKYLADKVKNGDVAYNWTGYADKFGFCNLEPIQSHEKVSGYITKYISKDLFKCVKELNEHTYYRSKGLLEAQTIKKGYMSWKNIQPTYKNDYCTVAISDYNADKVRELTALIN